MISNILFKPKAILGLINLQVRGLYSLLLPSLFFLSGWQSHLGSRFIFTVWQTWLLTPPLGRRAVCSVEVSTDSMAGPQSTTLAGRHVFWHGGALAAGAGQVWPPVWAMVSSDSRLAGPLVGSGSAAWSPV